MNLQPSVTTFSAPVEFFASEHRQMQPGGVTIDYTTVATGDGGVRELKHGARLGKITASGKYGPYDDSANDGREVGRGLCVLSEPSIDVQADTPVGMLIHGFVDESRLPESIDANFKADVPQIAFL